MTQKQQVTLRGHGGLVLTADRWARAGAPPLVLLHGGGQTRHAWGATGQMLFDRGYDVTSLDLRGHGDSGWSKTADYSLTAFRDDVRAVLDGLAEPAVLIGASLGGLAALLVAGEGPQERVRGLVLVDIAPSQSRTGAERILSFMQAAPDGFTTLSEAANAVAEYLPHRPLRADPSGLMKNLRARNGRLHWHWDPAFIAVTARERFSDDGRLTAAARQVVAPTLLVRGSESEIVAVEDVDELLRLTPQTEVIEIAGARHMVAGDQNTEFGRATLSFLERIIPARLG
jgi:non-heme chloroperoxidase